MKAFCYILKSQKLNKFYIGATTAKPNIRLERHIKKYYGYKKFTSHADDWELFLSIECESMHQAVLIEKHIKQMKSKKYIENLVIYSEITQKLLFKYKAC
ncbi:MAG: GIY-YIG nuclease family protein [Chlorobi bacterium]|nr:GIY-YIG nuclease family protein [Chlorobiota bacterium]